MRGGYHDEAMAWRDWLLRAVAGDPSKLQIMYGAAGERRLDEWEVDWLPGYEGSAPVRVGNAAAGQFQLDVYGEVMSALYEACAGRPACSSQAQWDLQRALIEFVEKRLEGARRRHLGGARAAPPLHPLQGHGLGGGRPGGADGRGVAELEGPVGPVAGPARRDPRRGVRPRGTTSARQAFTQYYGSDALDASLLMIPLVGFLPATDPRVRRTIEAIERELTEDGFVLRYRTDGRRRGGRAHRPGGRLPGVLVLAGRLPPHDRPRRRRPRALRAAARALRNDLGLLSEEYDPWHGASGRQLPAGLLPRVAGQRRLRLSGKPAQRRSTKRSATASAVASVRRSGRATRPSGRTPPRARLVHNARRDLGRSRRRIARAGPSEEPPSTTATAPAEARIGLHVQRHRGRTASGRTATGRSQGSAGSQGKRQDPRRGAP